MKSKTIQLIYQTCYLTLSIIAIIGSIGFYDYTFNTDFYIFFTNLCNYICAGIMFVELIQTARKKEDGYVKTFPILHFIGMLGLILTFLVFNLLLANDPARDPALNYKVECLLCHIVLPIMFVIDWLLFYEHGKVKWTYPLLSALFPIGYLMFVFIHAAMFHFDSSIMNYAGTDPLIYPYFFLNPERVGIGGMAIWIIALVAAFVLGGYVFMVIDMGLGKRKQS